MPGWRSGRGEASASTTTSLPATRTSTRWATRSRSWISSPASPRRFRWPARRIGKAASPPTTSSAVPSRYRGTQGTAIVGVFELSAAMTGASEKALRRAKRPYRKIYIHPAHHAGYYPGAEAMVLKLLFHPADGPDPRRPGRGRRGRRQADRRAGRGDPGGHDRLRPGRDGIGLRAAIRFGQGPDQHGRFRGRRTAAGRPSADRPRSGSRRAAGAAAVAASTSARRRSFPKAISPAR